MRIRPPHVFAAALLLATPVLAVAEQGDEPADDAYERCINTRLIRSTSVANDRNIVFKMRGSKIYLNTLPGPCPGLARERRFSYESHTSSLCKSDRINVMSDSGLGLQIGRSCRLGQFQLVTEQDLVDMFEKSDEPRKTRDVEAPDVEDVIEGEEAPPVEEPAD